MNAPTGALATVPTLWSASGNGSVTDVRRRIVQAATHAPSVHHTQPWRFASFAEGLDLYADATRRLQVLDPRGRQLHLSCGAALQHAQVAARGFGLTAQPHLLPDPDDTTHLARLHLASGSAPTGPEQGLADAIELRHTYRDAFEPQPLPDVLLDRLQAAAEAQGAYLYLLTDPDALLVLEVVLDQADRAEGADLAYGRELASWVHTGPTADGIPTSALPADAQRESSLRLRNFAPGAHLNSEDPNPPDSNTGDRGSVGPSDGDDPPFAERLDVAVFFSDDDTPLSWLRAGQALGAVLLQAACEGVMAQPRTQATDLPASRQRLGAALGLVGTPQLALRLGYATGVAATPRRDIGDVFDRQDQETSGG